MRDVFLDRVSPLVQREVTEARLLKDLHWSIEALDAAPPYRLRRYIGIWNEDAAYQQEKTERA